MAWRTIHSHCFSHHGPLPWKMVDRLSLSRVWSLGVQGGWARRRVPWESGPPPLGHAELPRNGQRWTVGWPLCPAAAAAAAAGGGEVVRSSCLRSASVHTQHRGWPRGGDMLTFRDNSWYQSGNKRCCQRQAETDRKREKRVSPAAQPVGRALATLLSSQA